MEGWSSDVIENKENFFVKNYNFIFGFLAIVADFFIFYFCINYELPDWYITFLFFTFCTVLIFTMNYD